MARARNIKPSFFQNEVLGELAPVERLAFIGLWTIADFKGCVELRPKRLKVQILPYDDCDFEKIAINLDKSGLVRIYSVQGQRYLKIINFDKHQNPHKNEREAGSDIPDLDEADKDQEIKTEESVTSEKSRKIAINPEQDGTAPADSLNLIPDSLNLIPDTGKSESLADAEIVASYLAGKIISYNPKAKINPDGWIDDIERAIRIDKRSCEDLTGIIDWMYTGNQFWVPNIMSGKKLREKYDMMNTQRLTRQKNQPSKKQEPQQPMYIPPEQRGFGGFTGFVIDSVAEVVQ